MTSSNPAAGRTSRWLPAARVLMWLAAVSALGAAVTAVVDVAGASDDTLMVRTWRMYGLFLSAGMFVLLAARPRIHGAVWALMIADKAALAVTGIAYLAHGGVADAGSAAGWDGALTVVLIAAFVMSRRDPVPPHAAAGPAAGAAPGRPSGE